MARVGPPLYAAMMSSPAGNLCIASDNITFHFLLGKKKRTFKKKRKEVKQLNGGKVKWLAEEGQIVSRGRSNG